MRYLERRPVRTKLQRKVITAANIKPETIGADEVNFGTAIITTETDTNNVAVDNPKDGLLIVSSTNGSSSVYSDTDAAFIPITDTAAQATADTALEESEAAAAAAVAAEAEAAAAAEASAAAETAAQASFDEAAASAAAAAAAEVSAQDAFDEAAASAAAAAAAETASTDSAAEAAAAAAEASAAAAEAVASAAAATAAFEEAEAAAASSAAADAAAAASEAEAAASAASSAEAEAAALAAAESADAAALDAADAAAVAGNAVDEATAAKNAALAATDSANKKNSVFRAPASAYAPATAPTANSIGDVWFDTTPLTNDNGAGGAKPKRWNGTAWESFGLSYAAITSLDADTITAGTLTGRTVKTSASGNRIELADTDVLKFWKDDATLVGTIQPGFGNEGLYITAGSGGSTIAMSGSGWGDDSSINLSTTNIGGQIVMFDDTYDGEAGGGIIINGNSLSMRGGAGGWEIVDQAYDAVIYGQGGDISILGGGAGVSLSGGDITLQGNLVLGYGTYQSGTGQPSGDATDGTIIFKYT
jgi:hypothetical protein